MVCVVCVCGVVCVVCVLCDVMWCVVLWCVLFCREGGKMGSYGGILFRGEAVVPAGPALEAAGVDA